MEPQVAAPSPDIIPADPVPLEPETLQPHGQPATPPPPKGDDAKSPQALAAYDDASRTLINARLDEVDAADAEFQELNKQAKDAKRNWEAKNDELHRVIKERRDNRGKPVQRTLLDLVPPDDAAPPAVDPLPIGQPDPTENLWRQFPLTRLTQFGATGKDIEKLQVGKRKKGLSPVPVSTVGELADYTAGDPNNPGYERSIVDFDGVGPGCGTRITEALDNFWGWWNGGGRREYGLEVGVIRADAATEPGPGAADPGPGDQGGGGEAAGQPAAAVATAPEGGPDEYPLSGDAA